MISLIFSNVSYALEDIKGSTNTLLKKPLVEKAKQRFDLILQTQEHLEQTKKVNGLWRRVEIEESTQEKLNL